MTFARWALILPIVWGVRIAAQDASAPTPLEQALIEHVCNASRVAGAVESGAYQTCLSLKLTSIRNDFGRDLSKLSVSERQTIDSTCSKVLETGDRQAYVECLSGQLSVISSRRARPAPALPAAAPTPAAAASPDNAALPAASSSPSIIWIGIGIGIVVLAASGAFAIMQRRRAPGQAAAANTCRNCGAAVDQPGGLCQRCRREAADAARQARAERVELDQTPLEDRRQRKAREEEAARLREQERVQQELEGRQRDEEANRREEEARRREEEARRASQAAAAPSEAAFDPYLTLGVSRDATTEQIRDAYIYAMSKYDLTNVEHLGAELQEHYKTKAEAVEQAFLMLTR
jgi:flagellar biosynthesis GTPase FlhF